MWRRRVNAYLPGTYFWFHVKADILAPLSIPMEAYDINLTGTAWDSSLVRGYVGIYIRHQ